MKDTDEGPMGFDFSDLDDIALMKQIRRAMLEKWLTDLKSGKLDATTAATITRLAVANGWVLDETRLPTNLKDKLTATFDPTKPDEDDKIIPIRAAGGKQS